MASRLRESYSSSSARESSGKVPASLDWIGCSQYSPNAMASFSPALSTAASIEGPPQGFRPCTRLLQVGRIWTTGVGVIERRRDRARRRSVDEFADLGVENQCS